MSKEVNVDLLRRELLISSEALRKASVAMHVAWALLSGKEFSASVSRNEGSTGEDAQNKGRGPQGPLPF